MKITSLILIFFSIILKVYTQDFSKGFKLNKKDTIVIIELNNLGFKNRFKDPELTKKHANRALLLATKLNYIDGIGESYRVRGIGKSYLSQNEDAFNDYLTALTYFKKSNNQAGEAKVHNNIGNLYSQIDYDKSLQNFKKSLKIAKKLNIRDLLAGLYLNIGTVHLRKGENERALSNYKKSLEMFTNLNNNLGITQSLHNLGLIYFNLNKFDKAEDFLMNAREKAKKDELNNLIGSINLTLSSIHIAQKKFEKAEKTILEGMAFAKLVKSPTLEYNYVLISYELENKRKNYKRALYYLQQVYKQDSITYKNNVSDKINLLEAQHKQLEKQRENELTIAEQKNAQTLFWATSVVTVLAFVVIILLIMNVRKSALTNQELTLLHQEVSKQKADLDKANQNLEELISVRTQDLKIKNKKLSEYSSHLSHQVRSPVATLKGLIYLEKDNLIEKEEFIEHIGKCINDLDDKIININENLNNPDQSSLINDDDFDDHS